VRVNDDLSIIEKMLCSIYPESGGVDYRHYSCRVRPVISDKPCYSLFNKDIIGVYLNNKLYSLNLELVRFINHFH
jgi:hypothetical protein